MRSKQEEARIATARGGGGGVARSYGKLAGDRRTLEGGSSEAPPQHGTGRISLPLSGGALRPLRERIGRGKSAAVRMERRGGIRHKDIKT